MGRTDDSMSEHIQDLHRAGREHYDTPASVMRCCCLQCNASRVHYGMPEKRWPREALYLHAIGPDGLSAEERRHLSEMQNHLANPLPGDDTESIKCQMNAMISRAQYRMAHNNVDDRVDNAVG